MFTEDNELNELIKQRVEIVMVGKSKKPKTKTKTKNQIKWELQTAWKMKNKYTILKYSVKGGKS